MRSSFKNVALVTLGVILGVGVTMQYSALAHKPVDGMPIEGLHQLAHAWTARPTANCAKGPKANSSAWASRSTRAKKAMSASSPRSRTRRPPVPASRREI
jgi:hypothetical protein